MTEKEEEISGQGIFLFLCFPSPSPFAPNEALDGHPLFTEGNAMPKENKFDVLFHFGKMGSLNWVVK